MKPCLTILLSLAITSALGQLSFGYSEGTIYKKNGDSLKCFVDLSVGYEDVVRYKLGEDGQVKSITVKQVSKIKTQFQEFENIKVGNKERIMAQVVRGPVSLYRLFIIKEVFSPGITYFGPADLEFVIRKNENFTEIREKGFKKKLKELLADCPVLIQRINAGYFQFSEMEKIITDYNNCNNLDNQSENQLKLIGSWKSDISDKITKNSIGDVLMTYTKEGKIIYDMLDEKEIGRMILTYRISGDTIITKQESRGNEEMTRFTLIGDDKLILEINGIRSVFLRKR